MICNAWSGFSEAQPCLCRLSASLKQAGTPPSTGSEAGTATAPQQRWECLAVEALSILTTVTFAYGRSHNPLSLCVFQPIACPHWKTSRCRIPSHSARRHARTSLSIIPTFPIRRTLLKADIKDYRHVSDWETPRLVQQGPSNLYV